MARMIHTVFSDVVAAEREDEFNRWYTTVHVPDVCAIPGVLSARRFRRAALTSAFDGELASGHRYLVVYEIETDDPGSIERELRARFADGRLHPTDTMLGDPPPVAAYFHEI
jgi:hypothetical protein